ncbi:MAG: hypothetical protein IPH12_19515 [Saprospirales bacterium]|nr:hypothetical protein [Saprospirales bacterium]
MSLQVLKSGLLDTIQDRGRFGYAHLGINPSGAMDTIALALANMLVGNPAETAALELHFPGPRLRFELPALFALGGGDFMPRLNGVPIPVHTPVAAGAGSVLSFSGIKTAPAHTSLSGAASAWNPGSAAGAPTGQPAPAAFRAAPCKPATSWRLSRYPNLKK